MVEHSAEQIAQRAFDLNLLDERQLKEIWGQVGGKDISAEEFRQLLLRRELLTNYQAELLWNNKRSGFFYGDYKVLYLVGTGTFARVYRAAHKSTGKIVAVKVLRQRFATDKEQAERFYREGTMGASLRHPNIVPIYEVYSKADVHFLVMEFVEGRNLREFIKIRKKFDPPDAVRLVTDIASGLAYAFERGIHHRDLKMSNVLVSSRGQAKLVDFGLAADGDMTDDEANPRTIDYAGLERATGVRKDDPRSDIYFLGSIFYHLLCGKPALVETRDRIQRLSKTRFENVEPILKVDPTIPRSLALIVHRAMEMNPDQRYQSPAEMVAELKMAAHKLNDPEDVPVEENAPTPARITAIQMAGPQRALMFVESDVELQNVFRERLKSNGYRVLVTRDPDRALDRFAEDPKTADCIIFSTGSLGEAALDAFNRFGRNPTTRQTPAILLLGEQHQAWKKQAQIDRHRLVVTMPVKLSEFRGVLSKLVPVGVAS